MIIERKYVTFRNLINSGDPAGKFFIEKFKESYPQEDWERIWDMLVDQCLYQREMGWCFYKLGDVIEKFEQLDKEAPFDNGCTYEDVNDIGIYYRDENMIVMHLFSRIENAKTIVQVVTIEN